MHSEFWWIILESSQLCLSNLLHLKTSILSRKIGPRRKQGLPRYLSCLLYNDIHLNTFYLVARCLLWSLEALKHDCRSKKKKWRFFLEVTYQKSLKTDPFLESIMQKTKNWHFGDHWIWGGSVSELHRDMPGSWWTVQHLNDSITLQPNWRFSLCGLLLVCCLFICWQELQESL